MPKQTELNVIEISIVPVKSRGGTLQGFASGLLVFGSYQLYLAGIGIHSDAPRRGFRLTYPTRKLQNGQEIALYHPVGKEMGDVLQNAIVAEWERLFNDSNF